MYLLVMVVACWYQIGMGLSTDQQFKPGHAGYWIKHYIEVCLVPWTHNYFKRFI